MSIKVTCPNCSGKFKAPDNSAGRRVKCPLCETRITLGAPPVLPPDNLSNLLTEELALKPEPALPSVYNRQSAALGVDDHSIYSSGMTLARRSAPAAGPKLSPGGSFSPFDFVWSHKFVLMVLGFSVAAIVMLLQYDRPIHAAVQGGIGIIFALGAWRSQSLARSRTVAAENWRSLEHIVGLVLILLLAGLATFVVGRRIYAIFDVAVPKVGMTSYVIGYLIGTILAWFIVIGICTALYRASEAYGFFRPGGWIYVAYFFIVWILAATGNLIGSNRDGGSGPDLTAANSLSPGAPIKTAPIAGRDMPVRPTISENSAGVLSGDVNLNIPRGTPGFAGQLYIYLPKGNHAKGSLGCVFIAAAGGTAISGVSLGSSDRAEHIPYAQAGFAVVAYETDGAFSSPQGHRTAIEAARCFREFTAAEGGLVNARNAVEFALNKLPEVDPNKLYAAGHSSAGTLALLMAESDSRIKAAIAYAPVSDMEARVAGSATGRGAEAESFLNFIRHNSPRTRESDLNCPVFIFHAADDSNIPISQSREFADRLRAMAKNVTFETVPIGDHYDSMIHSGIPKGIAWLRGLDGRKPTPKLRSTVIPNVLFPNEPQGNLPVDTPFTPPPRDSGSLPIEPSKPVAVTINGVELKPNDKLEFRRGGDNWEPVEFFGPGPANTVLILRKDLKHAMPVPIDRLRLPIRAN